MAETDAGGEAREIDWSVRVRVAEPSDGVYVFYTDDGFIRTDTVVDVKRER